MGKNGKLGRVHLSVNLTDKGQIDTGGELDTGWLIWIVFATSNPQTVDSVLMDSLMNEYEGNVVNGDSTDHDRPILQHATHMSWTDDCAVPVAHHDIVAILETVRARPVTNALLALLEFFEQPKIPGDY